MDHQLPTDLKPLPTQPWDERPDELPLDSEEARTAIWEERGNISRAAERLKVPSSRLRAFVKASPYLQREVSEASERLVDMAEDVVYDALRDPQRQDTMARFVLSSKGKSRGWGQGTGNVNLNLPKGPMRITWEDGTALTAQDESKTIDGELVDVEVVNN